MNKMFIIRYTQTIETKSYLLLSLYNQTWFFMFWIKTINIWKIIKQSKINFLP